METASLEQDNRAMDLPARWAGQEEGWARLYTFSLHHEPLFAHTCAVCSYAKYVVTYMCIRGGMNIRNI